jgi:hypothetical protein
MPSESSLAAVVTSAQDSNTNSVINILVALSPNAVSYLGQAGAEGKVKLAIDNFNQALIDSYTHNVAIRASHAGTMYVSQDYSGDSAALNAISTSLEAASFRDSTNADVVIFVAYYPNVSCGLAREIKASARTAFATVSANCLLANHSLAHEIGHLIGARHNPDVDNTNTPYTFGHGYWRAVSNGGDGNADCFHTIMSYSINASNPEAAKKCRSDPRINLFSSPITNIPLPSGGQSITGDSQCCDNASVMKLEGPRVASFGDTKISSGVSSVVATITANIVAMIFSD